MRNVSFGRSIVFLLAGLALLALGNYHMSTLGTPPPGSAPAFPYLDHWKLAQYHFNYADFGFIKRAFLGTFYNFDPIAAATPALVLAATIPALALAATLAILLSRLENRTLAVALLLSPAVFLNIGLDLGRFDQINYLILLAVTLSPMRWMILFLPLTILIHEAALFIHVPLAVTLHVQRHGITPAVVAASALTIATTAAVLFLSVKPDMAALEATYMTAAEDSLPVLNSDLIENMKLAYWRMRGLELVPFVLIGLAALHILLLIRIAARYVGLNLLGVLLILAALAPLALSVIGLDFPRWCALASINLILVILLARQRPQPLAPAWSYAVAAFAILGPMGIFIPFPLIHSTLGLG